MRTSRFLLSERVPCVRLHLWRRTREYEALKLFWGVLYCFSRNLHALRQIANERQDDLLWLQYGFKKPQSRESINRFLAYLSLVCGDVFDYFVKQVINRDLFDNTYWIDSMDVGADPADDEARLKLV